MAAIPPPNDNGSVVVRVPVPTAVQPQQPQRPRPSATFILPGGVTPDVPKKLARLAPGVKQFGPRLNKLWDQSRIEAGPIKSVHDEIAAEEKYRGAPDHLVLADYLDDHDDPRADIVRGNLRPSVALNEAWKRAGRRIEQTPFGSEIRPRFTEYPAGPRPTIQLSDGTHVWFHKYSRGKGGEEPAWFVGWTGPANRPDSTAYSTVMGHQQFKNWLRRFDKDELSRIVKGMPNGR